jgi:hypothetical protein
VVFLLVIELCHWRFFIQEEIISMAPSKVHRNKVQVDTSQEGCLEGNNFQVPDAQVNNFDRFDIVELNDSDKIDNSNTSEDNVAEEIYCVDRMRRALSTFASQSPVDDQK